MGITKREIAAELGVSKRTIANYIGKLGLGNHVSRNAELMEALAVERDRAARAEAEAKAQLAEANARVAELAGKLALLAERQQAIAATPWWRRGRMAMKLLGPGGE